jgi:hypothetical protein
MRLVALFWLSGDKSPSRNRYFRSIGVKGLGFPTTFWLPSYSYSMKCYSYSCSKRLGPVEYEYENTGIPVIMIRIVGKPKAKGSPQLHPPAPAGYGRFSIPILYPDSLSQGYPVASGRTQKKLWFFVFRGLPGPNFRLRHGGVSPACPPACPACPQPVQPVPSLEASTRSPNTCPAYQMS